MTLHADGITVWHDRAADAALRDVSLELGPGALVVVAGPNGAGKSTLFQALLGLAAPRSGRVTLEGVAVSSWEREALARVVGAVPQRDLHPFPQRVDEAVLLGRWSRLGAFGRPGAADRDAISRAMRDADITSLAARRTDTLSGGEWQRVRLARALAGEPDYLLLDEPATSLDLAHEMAMLGVLRHLADRGIGVLAITHHLNAAAQFADRIVLLDRGHVAADDVPRRVLTPEVLEPVFAWPIQVHLLADGTPQLTPLRSAKRP
jgi:iron complex transport system ATP-binding protein